MACKTLAAGTILGSYRIVSESETRIFGTIYVANHVSGNSQVGVVSLFPALEFSDIQQHYFLDYVEQLIQLSHPHVLPILDASIIDSSLYLITRLPLPETLSDHLISSQQPPFSLQETFRLLDKLGRVMYSLYLQRISCPYLYPDNIFLSGAETPLLLPIPFIPPCQLNDSALQLRQAQYMAPEQFHYTACSQSDQYTLACIVYQMLTGYPPFRALTLSMLIMQHQTHSPFPLRLYNSEIPEEVEWVLLKALSKQPAERYPDLSIFLDALLLAAKVHITRKQQGIPKTGFPQPSKPQAQTTEAIMPVQPAQEVVKKQPLTAWSSGEDILHWLSLPNQLGDTLQSLQSMPSSEQKSPFNPSQFPQGITRETGKSQILQPGNAVYSSEEERIRIISQQDTLIFGIGQQDSVVSEEDDYDSWLK